MAAGDGKRRPDDKSISWQELMKQACLTKSAAHELESLAASLRTIAGRFRL